MEIDPATICARTGAGEAELAQARSGLTLPQRKALSLLAAPSVYAEFAALHPLDPERLARDFARLAELGLITLQLDSANVVPPARQRADAAQSRPARSSAKAAPRASIPAADPQLQPVVIGAGPGRSPLKAVALVSVAVVALTAGWVALRDEPHATPGAATLAPGPAPSAASAPAIATGPAPARPDAAVTSATPSANIVTPTGPAASMPRSATADRKAAAREARPTSGIVVAPAPETPPVAVAQAPAHPLPVPPATGERVPEPVVAPVAASTPVAAPVLVASAARAPVVASPSVRSPLQPIVREAPEFPKEAVAEGVTTGSVKARVTVDASGKVAGVEIIEAQPRRVFDRAVRAALWRWQYEPGAPNRTAEVEVAFSRQ